MGISRTEVAKTLVNRISAEDIEHVRKCLESKEHLTESIRSMNAQQLMLLGAIAMTSMIVDKEICLLFFMLAGVKVAQEFSPDDPLIEKVDKGLSERLGITSNDVIPDQSRDVSDRCSQFFEAAGLGGFIGIQPIGEPGTLLPVFPPGLGIDVRPSGIEVSVDRDSAPNLIGFIVGLKAMAKGAEQLAEQLMDKTREEMNAQGWAFDVKSEVQMEVHVVPAAERGSKLDS